MSQGTGALGLAREDEGAPRVRRLGWPELERVLPDHGMPRGVVEIASPAVKPSAKGALGGGATTIALSAVSAAHAADEAAWCAWVTTPSSTPSLYAPSAAQAGVDLERLLVVRADPASLARAAVKVATSGAFDVVVVDAFTGLEGRLGVGLGSPPHATGRAGRGRPPKIDGALVVRKLSLAAEESGSTILLLTSSFTPRAMPWPVALRLEVERRPESVAVRVTKDRRGRVSAAFEPLAHGHDVRAMHVVRMPGA